MEDQTPVFSFEIEYAGETVICKVIMQSINYDVLFNERFMATIGHTGEWTWIQESGVILPDSVIEEIGYRIESEYK
ncbi:hypothetical protein SNE26_24580 [Mucilaginibacter sp. cycad4]|uniref:hypothetical protein n=1 Tax=Mucilaginibacter sp. cycad4 TaxID=3342096 RepID=UPI002AAC3CFE|nr:hypothetical protein [Mucilaginibacter gossypii]WPU99193.1 hypothetical protein SNE26_24580 [Mucilaginibacter gossypii]